MSFDPEKVERFDSEDVAHSRCVAESDYDQLLALYLDGLAKMEEKMWEAMGASAILPRP